jgi:hypothetical protein
MRGKYHARNRKPNILIFTKRFTYIKCSQVLAVANLYVNIWIFIVKYRVFKTNAFDHVLFLMKKYFLPW